MGNYKFRFSDMIPNAWFHKLKNMNTKPTPNSYYPKTLNLSKPKPRPKPDPLPDPLFTNSDQRKSYYFTRDLTLQPDPPRRSSRRRRSGRRSRPPTAAACSCGAGAAAAVWPRPESTSPPSLEECTNSGQDQTSSSEPDSVLTEFGSGAEEEKGTGHDISVMSWPGQPSPCCICKCRCSSIGIKHPETTEDQCRRLPPIITRGGGGGGAAAAASPARRVPAGVRLRANSPRIGRRRSVSSSSSGGGGSRRSVAESTAVVKASRDPRRDFRESMVEMILENDIRASNDLEELLACYLSLNSDEYHELIINVFKQIWFDFIHLRLK